MALPDNVFKSALAKVNQIKARQSSSSAGAQVNVFDDPPHLRPKKSLSSTEVENPSEIVASVISTFMDAQPDSIYQNYQEPSIPALKQEVIKNEEGTIKGTEWGTSKSTKKGTEEFEHAIGIHKEGTKNSLSSIQQQGTNKRISAINAIPQHKSFLDGLGYKRTYDSISGIPKKIIDIIFEVCRVSGARETCPIAFGSLVRLCNEKKNSVKIARKRLLEDGLIFTKNPPNSPARGRASTLIYLLSDDLFSEINTTISLLINNEHVAKQGTKGGTDWGTKMSISSRSNINSTTTDLPAEWKKINFDSLKKINFGIIELKNIYKKCGEEMTPEIVQDSINQFAFGIENNPDRYKNMKSPSAVLINHLSQGTPWKEELYISPHDKMRAEKEKKANEMLEKQFKEPKFLEWFTQLDETKKDNFVPQGTRNSAAYMISKIQIQKEHGKVYFDRVIWPDILSDLKNVFSE